MGGSKTQKCMTKVVGNPGLFEYHFASQMAGNYFSELGALLSRLDHGFTRTVVFGGNGCTLGIELVDGCPIRIEDAKSHVPVVGVIGNRIGKELVVGDHSGLFELVVDGAEMVADIFPEWVTLPWFNRIIGDAPNRARIVVWILSGRGSCRQQCRCEQYD